MKTLNLKTSYKMAQRPQCSTSRRVVRQSIRFSYADSSLMQVFPSAGTLDQLGSVSSWSMSRASLPIVYELVGTVSSEPSETPGLMLTAQESDQVLVCHIIYI